MTDPAPWRTLTYDVDANGFVPALVRITLKTGRELYLCNPHDQVAEAIAAREPFVGHAVVGLQPKAATLNPDHIALAEDVS